MSSLRPVSGTAQQIFDLLHVWHQEAHPGPLVLETSGSSGRPKSVVLSREAMRASAKSTSDRLGGPGQWILNLPPTYVAGLQVLYRSVVAGTAPVMQTGDLAEAVALMSGPRRYLAIVPTQLRRLLQDAHDTNALTQLDAVLVGGGALWPHVRLEAEANGVHVVQTYGMAETCGGCVYDGKPLDGVQVRVDKNGQVLLSGPMLFDGYAGDPERTALALSDGWLRSRDLGGFDENGQLRILGRVDSVIISGGVKVPAEAVEAMIEAHPDVHAVVVIGVPDDDWGERVTAVAECYTDLSLDRVRSQVIPRTWAPKQLVVTRRMPYLDNGMVERDGARRIALEAAAARAAPRVSEASGPAGSLGSTG